MRNRLIHYLDALFFGMILGLLFVTLVHASPASQPEHSNITHAMTAHHYAAQNKNGAPSGAPPIVTHYSLIYQVPSAATPSGAP